MDIKIKSKFYYLITKKWCSKRYATFEFCVHNKYFAQTNPLTRATKKNIFCSLRIYFKINEKISQSKFHCGIYFEN